MKIVSDKKAPGNRLIRRMSLRTQYWLLGGLSALLVGSGLSVLSEAGNLKHTGQSFASWFITGLYGFVLTIGGLGLMQLSTRIRVRMDVRKEIRKSLKKYRKQAARWTPKRENPAGGDQRG
jgi:hypothetical protein